MGSIGPLQLLLVLVVALLLFGGRGKISAIMGDMAKGIRSFRKGLNESDETQSSSKDAIDEGITINVTPEKDKTKS